MMLGAILSSQPYQSIISSVKLKRILQTAVRLRCLPDVLTKTTFYSSCWRPHHVFNDNKKKNYKKFILPINDDKLFHTKSLIWNSVKDVNFFENLTVFTVSGEKLFHTNSLLWSAAKVGPFDLNKASKEFFKINMTDLKKAPLPAFWVGFAGLGPFILPTFSSLIIGYSSVLSSVELAYGIAVLACLGGAKWGYLVANKEWGTWENYSLSGIPLVIATIAIACPPTVSFLLVIIGLLASFIIDLNTGNYPPWYKSLRGVLTNVSVFFLFIGMLQKMLH